MKTILQLLPGFLFRLILGLLPLIIGGLVTVGLVIGILRWDAVVRTTTVRDIRLETEAGAEVARSLMAEGYSPAETATLMENAAAGLRVKASILDPLSQQAGLSISADLESYLLTRADELAVASFNNEGYVLDSADPVQLSRRRIPSDARDIIFEEQDDGTLVGPYEVRREYYVARIEDQSLLDLNDIRDHIEERILADVDERAKVINSWLPILLCSCGLLLTFSAGLWNIGIEGQVTVGALGATSVALFAVDYLPRDQLIFTELFMAGVAGGAWALLTAIMRTRGGVNEIFGGVAMNFIATGFTSFLLLYAWAPESPTGSSSERFAPKALLPSLDEYPDLSPTSIAVTAFCLAFVFVIMSGSRWGLQLRAMGKNERSARVMGIPTERNIWLAMTICGVMAGLAGGHLVLFTQKKMALNVSGGIGFLALLIVLLASIRVAWVPFISLVFALFYYAGNSLEIRFDELDNSLIGVFVGLLVLTVFIFDGVRQRTQEAMEARARAGPTTDVPKPPPPWAGQQTEEAEDGPSTG